MKKCPFCNSLEYRTIPVTDSWTDEKKYRVVCEMCDSMGPASDTPEEAEANWEGALLEELDEEAMGGVSSPMATLNNTPGMGNVAPASADGNAIGSGDKFGDSVMYDQKGKIKTSKSKKKKKVYPRGPTLKFKKKKIKTWLGTEAEVNEGNLNPYDKIGQMMAKKMGIKPPFKKIDDPNNQNAIELDIEEEKELEKKISVHEIITFDEFEKKLNESKNNKIQK